MVEKSASLPKLAPNGERKLLGSEFGPQAGLLGFRL